MNKIDKLVLPWKLVIDDYGLYEDEKSYYRFLLVPKDYMPYAGIIWPDYNGYWHWEVYKGSIDSELVRGSTSSLTIAKQQANVWIKAFGYKSAPKKLRILL
jgi:hypothetical protein